MRLFAPLALLLLALQFSTADVVVTKPLKPVRCVCGQFVDPEGRSISDVVVTVLQEGVEIARTKANDDGRFGFDELTSGSYELKADMRGFVPFSSRIVVVNPRSKCKHGLTILLDVGRVHGEGSRVLKQ